MVFISRDVKEDEFMKKMCLILIFMFSSFSCFASGVASGVVLKLKRDGNFFALSIENRSNVNIKVSRHFTQNPAFGLIEFDAEAGGHRFIFQTPPNENFPTESDYIILNNDELYGRIFNISTFRKMYQIKSNCFYLLASYRDVLAKKFLAISETLKSNKIQICAKAKGRS